jgi:hypothetical protein
MKEEPKDVCINFRISKKYKQWLEELLLEEGQYSFSDYFNKQILIRKIESIINKLINEAKKRVTDEFKLPNNFSRNAKSPIDIEGIYPEVEEKFKEKWVGEVKNLFTTEFGLEDDIEDLANSWSQIANFSSDYSVIKRLTFLISQKSLKFRNLSQSGGE